MRAFVTLKCPVAQFPYMKQINIVSCFISSISVQYLFTLFRYKIIYCTVPPLFSSYICIKNFTPKIVGNVTKAFYELPLNCKNKDVYSLSVESNKVLMCIFLVTIFRFYTKQSWFLHGRAENGPSEPPVIGQEVWDATCFLQAFVK